MASMEEQQARPTCTAETCSGMPAFKAAHRARPFSSLRDHDHAPVDIAQFFLGEVHPVTDLSHYRAGELLMKNVSQRSSKGSDRRPDRGNDNRIPFIHFDGSPSFIEFQ